MVKRGVVIVAHLLLGVVALEMKSEEESSTSAHISKMEKFLPKPEQVPF